MEKEYKNFNLTNLPGNIDAMKSYFERRNATCIVDVSEENIYKFSFTDTFKSKEISVNVYFNLQELDNPSLKIKIDNDESINKYDIEDYSNHLLAQIYTKLIEGPNKYVVRVYARFYSEHAQELEFTFDWKNKITVTPVIFQERSGIFNADTITSSPHEQILVFDIEVFAIDVTSARTLAYNQAKEVFSFLAVLFDLGIDEYQSEQIYVLADVENGENNYTFHSTAMNKGFHDAELDLFVFDNLNGLVAINDQNEMVLNSYLTTTYFHDDSSEQTVVLSKDIPELNEKFKNLVLKRKSNRFVNNPSLNKEITYYNTKITMLTSYITFFRKLKAFKENNKDNFERFSNACKLYNKALFVCANEPTMMTAYLISSLEALLKMEINMDYLKEKSSDMHRFLAFVEKYTDEGGCDVEYFRYLYGTIRSGHFHSGDFKFLEYNVLLNQALSNDFIKARNEHIKARKLIRAIFINWIEKNILNR